MNIRRVAATFAAMILAGTALSACGSSNDSASAGGSKPIRVAFTKGATTLQVHLAEKNGYFKKHGVDVKFTEGLDLPTWAAGLNKQWDVALTSAGLFFGGAKKLNLTAVAGIQTEPAGYEQSYPLIVRGDSIKSTGDLEGKRVGVASLTGNTVNAIKYLVKKDGGNPDKVNLVQVPFPSAGDQLKAGQLDASISALPFSLEILKDPANKILVDVQGAAFADIDPSQDSNASIFFISNRGWAEKNSEELAQFRAALQDALTWIKDNKEEALEELSAWTGTPIELLRDTPWPLPTASTISADQLAPALELLKRTGGLADADVPDPDTIVIGGQE